MRTQEPQQPPHLEQSKNNPFGLTPQTTYNMPVAADMDNDGDFDLMVGDYANNLYFYEDTACVQSLATDVQSACDTYTWIDGNTYTSNNDTATHLLVNAAGCDSLVTLDLTINSSNSGTDTQSACDMYTWIDGNTYTSSNNTATHILTNSVGCDSLITLNLTINTVDNSVTQSGAMLTANQTGGSYQWLECRV